jgi:VanZ family protein
MCILFFLPGSALPKENNLFSLLHIDKLVHISLFAIFIFLIKSSFNTPFKYYNLIILFITGLYGYTVEIIQREWIPGRSFDLYDLLADIIGAITGMLIWQWMAKKNKPL